VGVTSGLQEIAVLSTTQELPVPPGYDRQDYKEWLSGIDALSGKTLWDDTATGREIPRNECAVAVCADVIVMNSWNGDSCLRYREVVTGKFINASLRATRVRLKRLQQEFPSLAGWSRFAQAKNQLLPSETIPEMDGGTRYISMVDLEDDNTGSSA